MSIFLDIGLNFLGKKMKIVQICDKLQRRGNAIIINIEIQGVSALFPGCKRPMDACLA